MNTQDLILHNFAKQACPSMVPVLLDQLSKQEEDQELDECAWTVAMAAGACLSLFAECVGNEIIPIIMPYVQVGLCSCSVNALGASRQTSNGMKALMTGGSERRPRMHLVPFWRDLRRRTWRRLPFLD